MYDLAPVAGWEPSDLHDLGHVFRVGFMSYRDPAQPLTTAGEGLDDPSVDR